MGRIKSTMVKRAARQLIDISQNFNDQFDNNKKILGHSMPSKPIRNKIAGYIARLKKVKKIKIKRENPEYEQASEQEKMNITA